MFELITFVVLILAFGLLVGGVSLRRARPSANVRSIALLTAGGLLVAALIVGNWALDLWGEYLWFQSEGYGARFRAEVLTGWNLVIVAALAAVVPVWIVGRAGRAPAFLIWAAVLASAGLAALAAGGHWGTWLVYRNAAPTGVVDPILARDVSFYLLELPFLELVRGIVGVAAVMAVILAVVNALARFGKLGLDEMLRQAVPAGEADRIMDALRRRAKPHPNRAEAERLRLASLRGAALAVALVAFAGAFFAYLERFHTVIQGSGWGAGAGRTDVAVALPALTATMVLMIVLGAAALIVAARATRLRVRTMAIAGIGGAAVLFATVLVGQGIAPALYQRFAVTPNELAAERPYIEHAIAFTRRGFDLHEVEERRPGAPHPITLATLEENRDLIRDVPLWDYRALSSIYNQLQRFRPYYTLNDVDIDRYRINGELRQVMISARELDLGGVAEGSRGFVNDYIKFVSGYGVIVTPVNEFDTRGGRSGPVWWARNMPMQTAHEELRVTRPEIYFGEVISTPALVNTREAQFHYPSGDATNIETHYEGTGGIPLSAPFARLAYAKRLNLHYLFTSSAVDRSTTRVLYRRQIQERVRAIAPFLALDEDPYVRIADGRLFWIIDAYTTSTYHPYSERHRGVNYIRNAVKTVVDAYNGTVTFYVFDEEDPIIGAWQRALPGVFRPASEMPASLREGVRYPETLLQLQGRVYARYHMGNPIQFYNDEERWEVAREIYRNREQAIEPYFILWRDEGATEPEFLLVMPFTPRQRPLMAGWLAGRSDGEHYGRLLAYKIPHDRQILGPAQFESTISGDPTLSHRLNLWNQGGSSVIRGNIITLPIGSELLHIEPIYLEAAGQSLPELQIVAVMHENRLGHGPTLQDALAHLLLQNGAEAALAAAADGAEPAPGATPGVPTGTAPPSPGVPERLNTLLRQLESMQEELRALQRELEQPPRP
jgi:uncharacterized protein